MKLNRDEFLETGYLIVEEAVPRDKLERVRQAYETLVNRQRENWKAERTENDPPEGVWETAPQPRLQLSRPPLVNQIDRETAPAVEVWLAENIHGVSTVLLDIADGAVTEMMMMCNPVRAHGPAKWHRDLHPIDTAPLQGYIDDILEGGPRYVQWNIPLYDDSVLWVVPGSHLRLNTPAENERMLADPRRPLPNGVQTHLKAGDGVVYILPILHWGSNYSPKMRRTVHGGFSTYTSIDDLSFADHISADAQAAFVRWNDRSEQMKQHTESALRAVLAGDGPAYIDALDSLHLERAEKGRMLSTVFLCKAALAIRLQKDPPLRGIAADLRSRVLGKHPITLNWGPKFADRFTPDEARLLWDRFSRLEALLQADEEHFVPGFQATPMKHYFNEMPADYGTADFIASWTATQTGCRGPQGAHFRRAKGHDRR